MPSSGNVAGHPDVVRGRRTDGGQNRPSGRIGVAGTRRTRDRSNGPQPGQSRSRRAARHWSGRTPSRRRARARPFSWSTETRCQVWPFQRATSGAPSACEPMAHTLDGDDAATAIRLPRPSEDLTTLNPAPCERSTSGTSPALEVAVADSPDRGRRGSRHPLQVDMRCRADGNRLPAVACVVHRVGDLFAALAGVADGPFVRRVRRHRSGRQGSQMVAPSPHRPDRRTNRRTTQRLGREVRRQPRRP